MSNNNQSPPRGATNKMLIDATHPEETRVVVLRNGRVEEFDYESAARKLLRGNIYLAKVTRVEPSLQAAFVDYGGNRHGFLAFNEIHPDYYQIPIADRRALIEAEAAAEAEEEAAADRAAEAAAARRARRQQRSAPRDQEGGRDRDRDRDDGDFAEGNAIDVTPLLPQEPVEAGADAPRDADEHREDDRHEDDRRDDDRRNDVELVARGDDASRDDNRRDMPERMERDPQIVSEPSRDDAEHRAPDQDQSPRSEGSDADDRDYGSERAGDVEPAEVGGNGDGEQQVETVVADDEDAMEEVPQRPRRRLRSYKIQEVTKRRQVLLVQVVKEERGTKGAALTTYLSLAGRYTVLMPNTARGGGISRKISNPQDRKRLKAIAAELDVPEGMGLIIRTAGAARTKQEIKRDYEYLLRLWESVRELALNSNAPALVYEEGNLIKRSIRDLYGKEVEEIIVAGEHAYREAKDFMRMLMPSHAKNVIYFQDPEPLFSRFQIERQLNAMFSPYVHLKSGGYLVINQTEALVAIDINSGKSTREFSIEETAYSTNMEAADEIARQLKLRDLAGLIVIDFIDMEEKRNNRAVERRIKDALRHDRARIQLGHISHFGLMEMSRQRMRTGVLEGSTTQCPHCQGTGIIRSVESVALAVLRGIEDALMAGQPASLAVTTTATVALYILNNKRPFITEIETRYGISITVQASEKMQGANFTIERTARREDAPRRPERSAVNMEWGFEDEDEDGEATAEPVDDEGGDEPAPRSAEEGEGSESRQSDDGRRRRRRRRRGRRDQEGTPAHGDDRAPRHETASNFANDDDAEDDRPRRVDDAGADANGSAAARAATDDDESDDVRGDEAGRGEARDAGGGEGEAGGERRRRRRRGRRGGRKGQERERDERGGREAQGARPTEAGDGDGDADHADRDTGSDRPEPSRREAHVHEPHARESHAHEAHVHHASAPTYPGYFGTEPAAIVVEPTPVMHQPARHEPAPVSPVAVSNEPAHIEPVHTKPAYTEPVKPVFTAAVPPPEPAPVAEPAAPVAPPSTGRTAPVASEPVLARVVVGPDNAVVEEADPSARPSRRGWWQRK